MPTRPLRHLFHPANADDYADILHRGIDHLGDHLREVTGPARGASPEQAAKLIDDIDLDEPAGEVEDVLSELSRVYLDDTVWFHEPMYAAHLNCPVVIPALLGELFVSSVNSSLDTFDQSVGATYIERHLIDWTAGRIGFGAGSDGVFTSGGSQSNLQALLLARGRRRGVPADRLRVLTSQDSHFSVQKSARLMGLSDDAVVTVPTDAARRMDVAALKRALETCDADGLTVMAVVATAGTTDFGAIDPMRAIAQAAGAYGAWMHVDAAYGGGLLTSPRRRHLLDGIELADSVTIDYHKTFFQPVSSSAIVVRDGSTLQEVTHHADYLNPRSAQQPNQVDKSLQTTRRFDALKLWITLRLMGADQIGDYFDTVIDLAQDVAEVVRADRGFELAADPSLSTVVFRYRPLGMSESDADDLNPRLRQELYAGGRAMVAGTKVDGRSWLKLTLLNPMATTEHMVEILDTLRTLAREIDAPALLEVS
ncbi:pyridoxal phosphate-dependent decarboxylase family protein [Luteipulveratus mongoliensis]|uniref:Pyridoxal-dependent decarboxylase n=1 Tax=Luteipulveratus mongoliensis TaxID=571913 RepID=A0A0K1JJT9_9MICO|nr:aspartate aminotransferase family protein [Luteipulveratus mongoliensis]AKU16848.1 hypothetical protein VV02_14840 [Luteipulveratus mongoliensis]